MADDVDPEVPSRAEKGLFDRGLFWLALVVVLAVVALTVSFLAEDEDPDADAAPAPGSPAAFCLAAQSVADVPAPDVEVGETADGFRAYNVSLARLAAEAPDVVASRIDVIVDSFDAVIEVIELPDGDGVDAVQAVTDALDAQAAAIAPEVEYLDAYVLENCGFSLTEQSVTQRAEASTTTVSPDGASPDAAEPGVENPEDQPPDADPSTSTTAGS